VLQQQHPRIYAELLLSGAGLQRLYHALGLVEGRATHDLQAAAITTAGLAGSDPLCVATLEQFCALLGAACANFLLANGCYEALYQAGGILPRMLAFLPESPFLARLHDAGPLQATLRRTTVNVITHRYPGLLGAGYAPLANAGD
ncbi:MAG: glucokinase, partial [Pseudomonas sp.]|nr:glucokinase [Pseudomonas sp.]